MVVVVAVDVQIVPKEDSPVEDEMKQFIEDIDFDDDFDVADTQVSTVLSHEYSKASYLMRAPFYHSSFVSWRLL